MSTPLIGLRPRTIYGLRPDIVGNVNFNKNNEVIYPAENLLIFHDYVNENQRIYRMNEHRHVDIILISPNRQLLAFCETVPNAESSVFIYDASNMHRQCIFRLPESHTPMTIRQMQWTLNSKNIVVLTYPPDEIIVVFSLDFRQAFIGFPTSRKSPDTAEMFACCLRSNNLPANVLVVAVGANFISYMERQSENNGFAVSNNTAYEVNFEVTSLAFILEDYLLLGTSMNEILLLHDNEILLRFKAQTCEFIDLQLNQQEHEKDQLREYARFSVQLPELTKNTSVVNLKSFKTGFAFVIYNQLYVFEHSFEWKFERKTVITLPTLQYPKKMYQIKNWTTSVNEDTVVATTLLPQIYAAALLVPETLRLRQLKFEPLGVLLHVDEIKSVSVCKWKPIILTVSMDNTCRIWNYKKHKVELTRTFANTVVMAQLHPMGIIATIAFKDQIEVLELYMDDINIIKKYNFLNCNVLSYSNLCAFMAVGYGRKIAIISVCFFEILYELSGHNRSVQHIAWNKNDKYFVSCDLGGEIIQWESKRCTIVHRIKQSNADFRTLAVSSCDPLNIFAITAKGCLYVYKNDQLFRHVQIPNSSENASLTCISLNQAETLLFIGNSAGELFNLKLPLEKDASLGETYIKFGFHYYGITKILFLADGTKIVTATTNGSLILSSLLNTEDQTAPSDPVLLTSDIILIPRSRLIEKTELINSLEIQLRTQTEQHQARISAAEKSDEEHMFDVHHNYCMAMQELNIVHDNINKRHSFELKMARNQLAEFLNKKREEVHAIMDKCSVAQLLQTDKFNKMRSRMMTQLDYYQQKLQYSEETLTDTTESMEQDFHNTMDVRRHKMKLLLIEYSEAKANFITYCLNTEDESGRHLVALQIRYEQKLYEECTRTAHWKQRSEYMMKRYSELSNNVCKYAEEVKSVIRLHEKTKETLNELTAVINDLKREIAARDKAVQNKENRITELTKKKGQLGKYKEVLHHKITALKEYLEPKNMLEEEKLASIAELEGELVGMEENNAMLKIKLKELKEKHTSANAELKLEQFRLRSVRESMQCVCLDLYRIYNGSQTNAKLITAMKQIFTKYSNDDYFKYTLSSNPCERDVLQRKRAIMEKVRSRQELRIKSQQVNQKEVKLNTEYAILCAELQKLQLESVQYQAHLVEYQKRASEKRRSKKISLKRFT